jgi:hypothetical protein
VLDGAPGPEFANGDARGTKTHLSGGVAIARLLSGVVVLAACGLARNADGTLEGVRGRVLRVAFSVDTP